VRIVTTGVFTRAFIGIAACAAFAGCHQYGPGTVQGARLNYNEIINRTSNEQLLLNLVRLRYRETPFFLEVGSVTTSFQFNSSIGLNGTRDVFFPSSGALGAAYAERPTISYSPIQGSKFAKQLLSPISLDTLVLMYHSGWSVERVFLCCVQMMNGVKNAPSASGPTPDYVPTYREFHSVAAAMRTLQKAGKLEFGALPGKERVGLAVHIAQDAWDTDAGRTVAQVLGIEPGRPYYPVTTNGSGRRPDSVGITTRSLLGTMFYLSQAVEVPLDDEIAGRVTVTKNSDGSEFDWADVVGKVITIRTGAPDNAAVKAHCKGRWFYIADDDLTSKSTFSLIAQLFNLSAGEVRGAVPLLTIGG